MAVPKITGVDWDLVNEDAANWARDHGGRLVKEISKTTRGRVGKEVANFYEQGQTIGELGGSMTDFRDRLGNVFGPQRAEMIAITEVTRAAAEGERAIARELAKDGIIMVEIWETRNDGVVCSTCEPRQGKQQGDGWTASDGPPGHPNCRCNIRHEFPKPKEGALEVGQEALGDVWQPSMNRGQAEQWAMDSVYQDDVYHGTSSANAKAIRNDGFIIPENPRFGRFYGDGVYLSEGEHSANTYARMLENYGIESEILKTKVNIRNPFYVSEGEFHNKVISPVVDRLAKSGLSPDEVQRLIPKEIKKDLVNKGFDSLITSENTQNILLIFDPKNVTIITG